MVRSARLQARVKGTNQYVRADYSGASQRTYDAAAHGRRLKNWMPPTIGPNEALRFNLPSIRNRSRDQIRQNPYASRASDAFVGNVVGAGLRPLSQAPNDSVRERLHELWRDWQSEADFTSLLNFHGLEAQVTRALFEGGECFVRLRERRLKDNLTVPMQLQVLESEHLDLELNRTENNGNVVRYGIEFDSIGRRVAYHFHRRHPGDSSAFEFLTQTEGAPAFTTRVPAEEVAHVYFPRRPGQVRGEPGLTQALISLRDMHTYLDAEMVRHKMGSHFVGFITSSDADNAVLGGEDDEAESHEPNPVDVQTLQPGSIVSLDEGEKVDFNNPPEVGANFEAFTRHQLRAVAQSAGVLYEQLTGDYSTIDDRTLRTARNDLVRHVEMVQQHVLVHQFCRRVWNWFYEAAVLSGALTLPSGADDRASRRAHWIADRHRHMHPLQDEQADRTSVRSGFKSRTKAAMERGFDAAEVDEEVAREQERQRDLGLVFDTDASQVSHTGTAQGSDTGFPDEQSGNNG